MVERVDTGMRKTTVFERYAKYYDLLYQEKDYEAECDFLEEIFRQFAPGPVENVLDLGCGSGGHALPLARRGRLVTGVDRSETMLSIARQKAAEGGEAGGGNRLAFHQADIRTLDLGQTFDASISMFAVISYQVTNDDLLATFQTARRHLNPGGLFAFDVWFGPAVLAERPADRFKILQQGNRRVIRLASPLLDVLKHTVQVNYKVMRLENDRVLDEVSESHLMRFLFPQEIIHYLDEASFRMVKLCPFMELEREATDRDWNVAVIAEAVG